MQICFCWWGCWDEQELGWGLGKSLGVEGGSGWALALHWSPIGIGLAMQMWFGFAWHRSCIGIGLALALGAPAAMELVLHWHWFCNAFVFWGAQNAMALVMHWPAHICVFSQHLH